MAKKNNQFNLPYTGQEVQQAVANGLIAVTTDPEQTFDAETQQMLRDKLGVTGTGTGGSLTVDSDGNAFVANMVVDAEGNALI